jgi:hypothetical protein
VLPSALTAVTSLAPLPVAAGAPGGCDSRETVPVRRSKTKAPYAPLASVTPGTRSVASLEKATQRPSALSGAKYKELPFAAVPGEEAAWLTSLLAPVVLSNRKTSSLLLVSTPPAIRSVAGLEYVTQRPSLLICGWLIQ